MSYHRPRSLCIWLFAELPDTWTYRESPCDDEIKWVPRLYWRRTAHLDADAYVRVNLAARRKALGLAPMRNRRPSS